MLLYGERARSTELNQSIRRGRQTRTASVLWRSTALMAALLLSAWNLFPAVTHAGPLAKVFVRFDRIKISTSTTGTVCAQPATAATETTVVVTFPTGYTLGSLGNFTVNTTAISWPSGAVAWPSIATATGLSGQNVTFPSGDLTVGTLYCFNWINSAAVTTKSSATTSNLGSVTTQATGPVAIDVAEYTTATIADDQIVVTATIPATFSFALSGNTDTLGSLATGAVTTSPTPRTATVNTNAKNGWMVWAKDSNAGLSSAAASKTIASTTPGTISTLVAGTEGYNTGVTSSAGGGSAAITVATPFNESGTNYRGGGLDTSLRLLASSAGVANAAVLTLKNNVAISATTPAATDYTDTITVIGAGLF